MRRGVAAFENCGEQVFAAPSSCKVPKLIEFQVRQPFVLAKPPSCMQFHAAWHQRDVPSHPNRKCMYVQLARFSLAWVASIKHAAKDADGSQPSAAVGCSLSCMHRPCRKSLHCRCFSSLFGIGMCILHLRQGEARAREQHC